MYIFIIYSTRVSATDIAQHYTLFLLTSESKWLSAMRVSCEKREVYGLTGLTNAPVPRVLLAFLQHITKKHSPPASDVKYVYIYKETHSWEECVKPGKAPAREKIFRQVCAL